MFFQKESWDLHVDWPISRSQYNLVGAVKLVCLDEIDIASYACALVTRCNVLLCGQNSDPKTIQSECRQVCDTTHTMRHRLLAADWFDHVQKMTSIHMSNAHMVEIAVARFSCCPQMTQSAKVQFSSYTVYDHIVVDTSHLFHLLTKTMTETDHFPLISVYCPQLSTKQSMSLPSVHTS